MPDATAPVPITDETTRKLFGEPSFRVAKRGGYDPGDVAEFLGGLGGQMITVIGRLRKAESEVEVLRTELGHWQNRARDAEATRETFERTLALAENTASAAVADARHRAAHIASQAEADADTLIGEARRQAYTMVEQARDEAQRSFADERMKVREEWQRVQDEGAQLETLRLAVAAETMALEEVRNELRRRIRLAATDLLHVAESPDCLGRPVAKGLPERMAPAPSHESEAAETAQVELDAATVATATATATASADGAAVDEVVEGADGVVAGADGVVEGSDEEEADPEWEGLSPAADAAFERFMSEEIEDEPSRGWILAG